MSLRRRAIVATLYLGVVLLCVVRGFDYAGSIRSEWVMGLVVLTLPWRLISVLFVWALIHGAGLEVFTFLYLAFAALNTFLLFRIGRRSDRIPRPSPAP